MLRPETRSPKTSISVTEPVVIRIWVGLGGIWRSVHWETRIGHLALHIVAAGRAAIEPDPGLSGKGIAPNLIRTTLTTEVGVVHVWAPVRARIKLARCRPVEQAALVIVSVILTYLPGIVPDSRIATELVDPEEISAAIT